VKPWYQGKLAVHVSIHRSWLKTRLFTLIGGRLTYAQHRARRGSWCIRCAQHKMSVFIFQARDVPGEPSAGNQTFVVNGWQQGGLQYYIVTDAAREDADRLRALLQDAKPVIEKEDSLLPGWLDWRFKYRGLGNPPWQHSDWPASRNRPLFFHKSTTKNSPPIEFAF